MVGASECGKGPLGAIKWADFSDMLRMLASQEFCSMQLEHGRLSGAGQ
jgi:hypothetical protein